MVIWLPAQVCLWADAGSLNTCLLALMLVQPSLSSANEGLPLELDPPPSDTYNQGFRDLSLRASHLSAP